MPETAFPRDEHLTSIAIAYKNPDIALIADEIFPYVPVGMKTFKYWEYPVGERFHVPNTRMGESSAWPEVKTGATPATATCEDHGIQVPISNDDISNAEKGIDPRESATEQATNIVLLDREQRAAAIAFDADQYPTENKTDFAGDIGGGPGAEQWDEAGASPLLTMMDRLENCLVRPNVIAFGQPAWNAFRKHPDVVSAALGNEGTSGFATRQRVAELLEVNEVIVGTGWVNIVKPGKTPSFARVWGKHALAFFRDRTVTPAGGGLTFGFTGRFGTRIAGVKELDRGLNGAIGVRSGESCKELVVASRAAHFFENVIP